MNFLMVCPFCRSPPTQVRDEFIACPDPCGRLWVTKDHVTKDVTVHVLRQALRWDFTNQKMIFALNMGGVFHAKVFDGQITRHFNWDHGVSVQDWESFLPTFLHEGLVVEVMSS